MRLKVDETRCRGCQICEAFCSFRRLKVVQPGNANLKVYRQETEGIFKPMVCRHCAKPACAGACPEGALVRQETGIVELVTDKCIGCGKCIEACPFKVLFSDLDSGRPRKCDLCQGDPLCTQMCPHGAITRI